MKLDLQLDRPLAFIDLETTGTNTETDRIVQLSIIKVHNGEDCTFTVARINPGMPIPEEATEIHGITNESVAKVPGFRFYANAIATLLEGADLCGYGIRRFDIRVLSAEMKRCGIAGFPSPGTKIVDVLEIFHHHEPRTLSAAVRKFLGREHEGAHGAEADVRATIEILQAMKAQYNLPDTVAEIADKYGQGASIDLGGFFGRKNGKIFLLAGKHKGKQLDFVADNFPDYLQWMLRSEFGEDTKTIARNALGRTNG